MPLFMRHIDPNAPMELYTLANPIMIVCFQMLITRLVKKWTPIKSIMVGVGVTTPGHAPQRPAGPSVRRRHQDGQSSA